MRAIIYGAGALGCFYGARLQESGHDVTYIARGAHLEAMQRNGLRIESRLGDVHIETIDATDDPTMVRQGDLIFFAVKNYDVETAIPAMAGLVGADTRIITVQNGVWAQPLLADRFGRERVLPGVVVLPADIKAPGVIRTPAEVELGGLTFGPYGGGVSEHAVRIHDAFVASGVPATLTEDIWRALWEKFIRLSAYSAMTVSARLNIGAIQKTAAARDLMHSLVGETAAIARASHGSVPPDAAKSAFDFLMSLPSDIHASMLDDLLRGKRIELDWLSGEVIRRGRELGIPTPSHAFAHAVLSPYIGGRPEGAF
ncbi:ketopantoate reductase family protein [Ovoidimarina sediminis]|uniref:ketopantoate reductase family protein n=1 Tax=Ovoidimarina sediminis TaxID=3079856 RepID=UPI00290A4C4D|nr:2-dehydropantoate 2-reductase [Rhodophyticola sp. MJ-SS7]MDU8945592.1 2-dehydropantoate 2-reductase [Rhodophyticola sp. MJ-SS7]